MGSFRARPHCAGGAQVFLGPGGRGRLRRRARRRRARRRGAPNEPTLTPAAARGGQFGQIFSTSVNGQVYSQPLVVGSTLIVTTENNWVYGMNASTGAILWSANLGKPYNITSCNDLTPNIG